MAEQIKEIEEEIREIDEEDLEEEVEESEDIDSEQLDNFSSFISLREINQQRISPALEAAQSEIPIPDANENIESIAQTATPTKQDNQKSQQDYSINVPDYIGNREELPQQTPDFSRGENIGVRNFFQERGIDLSGIHANQIDISEPWRRDMQPNTNEREDYKLEVKQDKPEKRKLPFQ